MTDISSYSLKKQVSQEPASQISRHKPGKPVLFLLHGVGGSARVFENQRQFFAAQGFEVVIPELVGHGYSPQLDYKAAYLFDELMFDIFVIFDMFCKAQNVVVGHSYGYVKIILITYVDV